MCGIIGFTGKRAAQDILLDGLQRLEYRGYDSAGIAFFKENSGHISVRKTAGKVSDLRAIVDEENISTCGIGHTRWATHGGVTNANAHPHRVNNVTLIHNGIIENYHQLIEKYKLMGKLRSETDTEVAAAVFDANFNGNPIEAIKKGLEDIKGSFAFCIMFKNHPGEIYIVRNVSPMVATYTKEQGAFVASDLTAFIEFTNKYFVLPEYCIGKLTKDGIEIHDLEGKEVEPEYLTVDWDVSTAEKNGYPHYMIKEIHEQPTAFANTVNFRIKNNLPDFSDDGIDDSLFEGITDVTVIACGTAMYAGNVGRSLIQNHIGLPVNVAIASEFRYERPTITDKTLVIVVSQSGETIDTLEALRLAKTKTDRTLAVVNVKGSTIARESKYVLYTHAGPEIAVASTKAYTVQVAAMYLIGARIGVVNNLCEKSKIESFIADLKKVPDAIKKVLEMEDIIRTYAARMANAHDAFFIGRGLDYTLSMEGALKLKEISYIHAEAYAAGELKHGTIALISEGVPVIAIATQEHVYQKVISNIREVKARGAFVVLLSKDEKITDPSVCDVHIPLPAIRDELSVFEAAVILQILAYYTSVEKDVNPDQPRNLAKSVTVE
ncbi:MAG: glutamine--fructose-6-phosphate transaminase (isomerizing) [Lachnospiraceae bacterium]|nr:glutamine--fructose-6-phosphate transaminase (isomerizing) [Lachnospiraceae bacterium]